MRLSPATADRLPADVELPGYNRDQQRSGIVHLGIGAFHRAHQAVYTDDAMAAGDRDWGITGVSLQSAGVRDQLVPQAGLYTVTMRSDAGAATRLIGAVRQVIVAPEDPETVITAIASPDTQVITLTVTEKGYWRDAGGGLDRAAKDIASDIAGNVPQTIYGYLAQGLARRRATGLAGLSIVSCDNLAQNGVQTAALIDEFLESCALGIAGWFRAECSCPSTMVDRIVPATTEADLDSVAGAIGMADAGAVVTEPYSQWVIEDRFAGPRPRWECGGAQLVTDVASYEMAKLRMLNGAHSALAYLGQARGHVFVHQAIADPALAPVIRRLLRDEAATSLPAVAGQDLATYADALTARFANAALPHRLTQIAMDGSQKIPQRWLETLRYHQRTGRECPAILSALAAWVCFVRGDRTRVDDPLANRLASLWTDAGSAGIIDALFGPQGLFAGHWIGSTAARRWLTNAITNPD